ncbi:response regulator transcription factor [Metabacillus sp. GX 13764]|uniref:response regulator transcription factor n=1 Tax=Metabacillus kandeliae TaxID=2900151 RepID=UPI001E45C317|nr:response regulator transcription factor [Metabacillus kandeliae]MCD7034254.1 response regulator transcription factor [Metabacillus kandeliae]
MINVLMVNGTRLLRESLIYLIEKDSELKVIGSAENGVQALELCKTLAPDIVLIDVDSSGCEEIDAARLMKTRFPHMKIIILTSHKDSKIFTAGADGYLLKSIKGSELILAVKCVANNMKLFHQDVLDGSEMFFENYMNKYEPRPDSSLTIREIELIKYIAEGKTNKEIAGILYLSEGRIKNIVTGILKKSALQDRTQLAVYAIKQRYV